MGKRKSITIGDIYPDLSPQEQQEVRKNIENYLRVMKKIYDDLEAMGELIRVLLRHQYNKRNTRKKPNQ